MEQMNPVGNTLERVGPASNVDDVNALMLDQGFTARESNRTVQHRRRVTEAARLMADTIEGKCEPYLFRQALRPTSRYAVIELSEKYPGLFANSGGQTIGLRETMSYSDYSALTVDVLDRLLYGYYTAAPITNMPLVKARPLRDFRIVARYAMDYATKPWTRMPDVDTTLVPSGAGEPPTERAMQQTARQVAGSTQRVTYQPQLYQGMMSINWRALVNDDLGIFQDETQRLAIGGRRTIYQFITSLYVDANGPHATLYNSTFANLITQTYGAGTNNPPLSIQGLMDGITVIERQLDLDGQPITFDGTLYLWHGPGLETTAQSLMKTIQADVSVGGGTTNTQGFPSQRLRITPWMMANMQNIQDKYIRIVCTTSGVKDTMWGLTYDPSSQARPSLELGQLTGFAEPQLFQQVPNTARVGGGVDPMMGDFYSGNQNYKGCLVMGGTQIDGRSTCASTGQGT